MCSYVLFALADSGRVCAEEIHQHLLAAGCGGGETTAAVTEDGACDGEGQVR